MGTADPKAMPTPENKANDTFANILKGVMSGGDVPGGGNFGDWVQNTFRMPAYGGKLSAGATPLQTQAAGTGGAALDAFFRPGGIESKVESGLTGIIGDNTGITTPQALAAALDPQRRATLSRDLGDMQEKFGTLGLSGSTSLGESGARAATESQGNLLAEVSRMAPQLEAARQSGVGNKIEASRLMAGLPGVGMDLSKSGFDLGEGMRGIEQGGLDRLLQEFIRQNSMFPNILSYLAGTPQQPYAPSTLDNILKVGSTGAAAVAAI